MSGLRERWLSGGIEQGERDLLYRLLTRRFGPPDEPTEARLQQTRTAELERWVDKILDARTLDEVFTVH